MKVTGQPTSVKAQVDLIPLGRLAAGQGGCVGAVLGTCDMVHRLREMGLYDGSSDPDDPARKSLHHPSPRATAWLSHE